MAPGIRPLCGYLETYLSRNEDGGRETCYISSPELQFRPLQLRCCVHPDHFGNTPLLCHSHSSLLLSSRLVRVSASEQFWRQCFPRKSAALNLSDGFARQKSALASRNRHTSPIDCVCVRACSANSRKISPRGLGAVWEICDPGAQSFNLGPCGCGAGALLHNCCSQETKNHRSSEISFLGGCRALNARLRTCA